MTYQQARRIRNKDYSLSNLITRNIRTKDMGAFQSVKEAFKEKFDVKTRLKAKVTGIKEKFDPLNIAKFLTFGSNVAPALLGKMTGRSKADIRNFTGGRQSYDDYSTPTATKIGKDPSAGGDMTGMSDILEKILELQKRSFDNLKEQRETKNNFQEERDIESQKRHNELLKAIRGFKPGESTPTAGKVSSSSGLDIMSTIESMLAAFGGLKSLLRIGAFLIGPVGGALVGVASIAALGYLLFKGYQAVQAGPTAEQAAEMLRTTPPQAMSKERREELEKIVKEGGEKSAETLKSGNKADIEAAGGEEKLKQQVENAKNPTTLKPDLSVKPRPIPNGKNDLQVLSWDSKYGQTHNPDGTPKDLSKKVEPKPTATPETKTETTTPAPTTNPTPAPVATPPASQQLNQVTSENRNAKIESVANPTEKTVNNVQSNTQTKKRQEKDGIPTVRNMEPTFQRMIFNSTRIV